MPGKLQGKVALVTGGSSGIGRASALAFSAEGAKVVVADVDIEGGEEMVRMIKEAGGDSIFVRTDVSKASEVEAMVNETVDTYGQLDCALNNAGVEGCTLPIVDLPEEQWDRLININLKGVWLCMKYEIPQMLRIGKGAIVNTASVAGLVGDAGSSEYVASKHGIVGITKSVALEYAESGIRINGICPGVIHTPLTERLKKDHPELGLEKEFIEKEPIGRLGTPAEVAEAVVWLCSDSASFVIGHLLAVDGGWTAG